MGGPQHKLDVVQPAAPVERITPQAWVDFPLDVARQELLRDRAVHIENGGGEEAHCGNDVKGRFFERAPHTVSHDCKRSEKWKEKEGSDNRFHEHGETGKSDCGDESSSRGFLVMANRGESRRKEQHDH